jgi:DNA recombination-dependent growth factor C
MAINETGFTFAGNSDQYTSGLNFFKSKQVTFLPENVSEKFPNLMIYDASYCRVKAIERIHFFNLTKLEKLDLKENIIREIAEDTFEDLVLLKVIILSG